MPRPRLLEGRSLGRDVGPGRMLSMRRDGKRCHTGEDRESLRANADVLPQLASAMSPAARALSPDLTGAPPSHGPKRGSKRRTLLHYPVAARTRSLVRPSVHPRHPPFSSAFLTCLLAEGRPPTRERPSDRRATGEPRLRLPLRRISADQASTCGRARGADFRWT